ncbi:hypothetical protein [Oceanobacillus damuensis]|uniref:hypothetical protein n=1 Tax=Oceanobacillus damuensis TaxID=937928 RepID=UPI000835568E|nr:hypothetical protein [Oceanobacillus damuensis]
MTYKITTRQQATLDELKAFHFDECPSINWVRKTKEPFPRDSVGPNERTWSQKESEFDSNLFSRIAGINSIINSYYRLNINKAIKRDTLLYQKWEENYPFAKNMMEGHQESWREAIKKYASFHENCDVAQAYSLHVFDSRTVECDVFLHKLEKMIPSKIEKTTKKGKIRYHEMPKTKRYDLYQYYVYSCLNKIINDLFAVLPCERVFINGVSGSYENHQPILSIVVVRKEHKQNRCPKRTLVKHRHIVTFKKRSGFYPLYTVYSPQILLKEKG